MEDALREFIKATLQELRVDPHMMKLLKGSDLRDSGEPADRDARGLASEWIDDIETELGHPLRPGTKLQVTRFVTGRWPGLLKRFNGNVGAARQTLSNILDTKFSTLRLGD